MADITVFGNKSIFNEDAEFFKDVYIYGKLYYDDLIGKGTFDNLTVNGDGYFGGDVYIKGNLSAGIITAREKLDVGIGGTILTTSDGRIGLGITNPSQNFEVIGSAYISNSVGIGSTLPEQKLDVAGSVKIDQDIYDAANNPGVVGAFLTKDAEGIKWTAFEPSFTEGIFVYNDGVLVGPGSYRGLNLKTGNIATEGIRNSSPGLNVGIVTDTIQTFVSPLNPDIADIYVFDAWEIDPISFSVYRNSRVGIQNPNPVYDLDVNGTVYIAETLDVEGATSINNILDVDGATTLNSTLDVDGETSLNSNLDVDGATTLNNTLGVSGPTSINNTLDVSGSTLINNTLDVSGQTVLSSTLDVGSSATLNSTLDVDGATTLNSTLDVDGGTTLNSILDVDGATTLNSTLDVDGATTINNTLTVSSDTALQTTVKVGAAGTVITTTNSGFIGLGTNNPSKPIDAAADLIIRKSLFDSNAQVGYDTSFYKPPRAVLTQVGIGTSGEIIGGRFFDAANMIRLNLDFIAAEAVGFITSTDYKNPAFIVPGSGGVSTCRSDITKILKAITLDITKGGNSQSVGAGLSYYNGNSLIHITGNDINGYSIKTATIDAIKKAAEFSKYVINNASLPKSYQSGITSIRQIKDLTLQNDPVVGVNTNPDGCANVVSAIYTCAGIVTTIIENGPTFAPNITYPNGKVVWAPAGADSRNLIWVSKYGNDDNTGSTEGDAKLTIGAACAIAEPGDTVMVRSGVYYENNPIGLRTDVTVSGQDLRLVTVVPLNPNKDVFHVRRGCLIENLNFAGSNISVDHSGCGAVAFPPTLTDINAGKAFRAVTGYTALGPANEGPSGRWRSPYVRNCTNFMTKSIGMKINGNHAVSSTIGADLKCMVCDSFTQYNEAGIGVSITNNGYAQLVSIFTINCDIAIYCDTGGQCDLTNSNSSFGNFGLYAVGLGATEFTGKVRTTTLSESDVIAFKDVTDGSQPRRPYDGQALYFKIDLGNYNNGQTGILTSPLRRLKAINVVNGGSGYSPSSPPDITIYDFNTGDTVPLGPEGIIAEVSPTIDPVTGSITVVDIINSGRNYLPTQDMRVRLNGLPTDDLVAVMEPIYYTVGSATSVTSAGITTVTLNEFVPYFVYENDEIEMRRISRILTSGHSFEYIGTGTDINTSTPLKGAVPIKENEIVYLDGAQIPYTSTDQQGNFNIGEGIQINQNTSTITGRDFSKAIQAEVTPLILALR